MMLLFYLQTIILALFDVFPIEGSGKERAELEFVLPLTPKYRMLIFAYASEPGLLPLRVRGTSSQL